MNRFSAPRPRPLHRRFAALLWAVLFLLGSAGEGFGLHPCPHHGNGEQHAEGDASTHAGHAAHGEVHAAAAQEAHHASAAQHRSDHGSHDGPCTCGSACQASATLAVPTGAQAAVAESVVPGSPARIVTEGQRVPSRPPHFLPFSQAPPRAR